MTDLVKGTSAHVFGMQRPSQTGKFPIHTQPPRDVAFRPLPPPTGSAPFRLDIKDVVSPNVYAEMLGSKRLVFHLNGDMGGIMYAVPQEIVAKGMEQDFNVAKQGVSAALAGQGAAGALGTPGGAGVAPGSDGQAPAFLYITGDCVYFNGEISEYYKQFYQPYEFYLAPIFAVPGNHDGENLSTGSSLDGFLRNFCQDTPKKMPESMDSHRTAMVQPNVYWTLVTPQVNIVGLYSNVPAGGEVQKPQLDWLVNELKTLPRDIPLMVALHHPIYSADDHHSGSSAMKKVIEDAAIAAGRHPDAVLAGHVHNYQRITKHNADGTKVPYLVTGAGGYHNLHTIMKVQGERMVTPVNFTDATGETVSLECYSDDHHGFLRLELAHGHMTGRYYEVPRPQEPYSKGNHLLDYFEFDFHSKTYVPNQL